MFSNTPPRTHLQKTKTGVMRYPAIVDLAYKYTNKINYQLLVRALKKVTTSPNFMRVFAS
jgi:hypothetical protein